MKKCIALTLAFFMILCINSPIVADASSNELAVDLHTSSLAAYMQSSTRNINQEPEHTISYVNTPNGSQVLVKQYIDDYTEEQVDELIELYSIYSPFKDAELLANPTTAYNCHSYAWYSQDILTNTNWMPYPTEYYTDYSYYEVSTPRAGDIICYFDDKGTAAEIDDENIHSGIVVSVNDVLASSVCGDSSLVNVQSKWGQQGLFYHRGDICPYVSTYEGFADYVKFFRPRTHDSYSLSDNMSDVHINRTINANGSITNQYGMYELNVTSAEKYTITIQSIHDLNNKLYDANMNEVYMKPIEAANGTYTYIANLPVGRYYLRTAYTDATKSGIIQITLEPHAHGFNMWTYYNYAKHIETCCCGDKGTVTENHAVLQTAIVNNRATCLGCGYLLNLKIHTAVIQSIEDLMISNNGSYVLPSGVVVLVEEDLQAYFDGTLIFYSKEELPLTQ